MGIFTKRKANKKQIDEDVDQEEYETVEEDYTDEEVQIQRRKDRPATIAKKVETKQEEPKIQIVTFEQAIMNDLGILLNHVAELTKSLDALHKIIEDALK